MTYHLKASNLMNEEACECHGVVGFNLESITTYLTVTSNITYTTAENLVSRNGHRKTTCELGELSRTVVKEQNLKSVVSLECVVVCNELGWKHIQHRQACSSPSYL
jgi:hypothetical protein